MTSGSRPSSITSVESLYLPTMSSDRETFVEMKPLLNSMGKIQFQHGPKRFVIKLITQRIGTEEKNIDLSYFTDYTKLTLDEQTQRGNQLNALIEGAKKAIDAMDKLDRKPADLANAHSFTLNFSQKHTAPSVLNHLLGKRLNFEKWKFKPETETLETIVYKAKPTSEEKTFTVHLEKYDPTKRKQLQNNFLLLNNVIRHVANNQSPEDLPDSNLEEDITLPGEPDPELNYLSEVDGVDEEPEIPLNSGLTFPENR